MESMRIYVYNAKRIYKSVVDAIGVRQTLQMKLVDSVEKEEGRVRGDRKLRGWRVGMCLYMKIYGDMV